MRTLRSLGICLASASVCLAGEEENIQIAPIAGAVQLQPASPAPTWTTNMETDYTFGSRFKDNGAFGSQAEFHYSIQAAHRVNLGNTLVENFLDDGFRNDSTDDRSTNNAVLNYGEERVNGGLVFRPLPGLESACLPDSIFSANSTTSTQGRSLGPSPLHSLRLNCIWAYEHSRRFR